VDAGTEEPSTVLEIFNIRGRPKEMTSRKAETYRRDAAICIDIAKRISITEERELMLDMAQRWLRFAEQAETQEAEAGDKPAPDSSTGDRPDDQT
jgi:hypothetical protein